MSPSYLVSPARAQRPRAAENSSPTTHKQLHVLRFRTQPPASPTRLPQSLHLPASLNDQPRAHDRGVSTPASSYSFRHSSTEVHPNREEEDHASTQLILLLTLSVVLLTLPWVVDHPVTLLVPLGFLILPITSGALRSMVSEGFSLVFSGLLWFWRHRKAEVGNSTSAQAMPAGPQRQPHPSPGPSYQAQGPIPVRQPHGASPHMTAQHGEAWHPPAAKPMRPASRNLDQQLHGAGFAGGFSLSDMPQRGVQQCQRPVAPVCHMHSPAPELSTPDLDFDSESEGEAVCARSAASGGVHQHAAHQQYLHCHQHQASMGVVQAAALQQAASRPQAQPSEQVQCTVYNWDEAECNQRRGHRSLAELLNNGQ